MLCPSSRRGGTDFVWEVVFSIHSRMLSLFSPGCFFLSSGCIILSIQNTFFIQSRMFSHFNPGCILYSFQDASSIQSRMLSLFSPGYSLCSGQNAFSIISCMLSLFSPECFLFSLQDAFSVQSRMRKNVRPVASGVTTRTSVVVVILLRSMAAYLYRQLSEAQL